MIVPSGKGSFWSRYALIATSLLSLEQVREYMFRTVSQITLNYRSSPLAVGEAGEVKAGDRLPWTPEVTPHALRIDLSGLERDLERQPRGQAAPNGAGYLRHPIGHGE